MLEGPAQGIASIGTEWPLLAPIRNRPSPCPVLTPQPFQTSESAIIAPGQLAGKRAVPIVPTTDRIPDQAVALPPSDWLPTHDGHWVQG